MNVIQMNVIWFDAQTVWHWEIIISFNRKDVKLTTNFGCMQFRLPFFVWWYYSKYFEQKLSKNTIWVKEMCDTFFKLEMKFKTINLIWATLFNQFAINTILRTIETDLLLRIGKLLTFFLTFQFFSVLPSNPHKNGVNVDTQNAQNLGRKHVFQYHVVKCDLHLSFCILRDCLLWLKIRNINGMSIFEFGHFPPNYVKWNTYFE